MDERSRPADWSIRPHTHADLSHIFYVAAGSGQMRADGEAFAFSAPSLLLVPAGVVHGFSWAADSQGSVLTLSESYFVDLTRRSGELANLFSAPAALEEAGNAALAETFIRLGRELGWKAPGRAVAVEALLLTLLVEALRLNHHAEQGPRAAGPQAVLVAHFRELLEARYRSETRVEAYAEALSVTPKRLRNACARVASANPAQMIQDRLLLEARRLLLYSNMTVAETAYYLGYDDPAYFTRVFSKRCRVSPLRFRQGDRP